MKKIIALFVIVFLFASTGVQAQDGWRFIADKWVSFGIDHDVIIMGNTNDDFRKLKLRVTDGPLKMYDMKIYFDNGGVQDVKINKHIKPGPLGFVIDLNGGVSIKRHIKKIEFWYETKGFKKGRSRVAVWGKK
jgi:hypothetical protein